VATMCRNAGRPRPDRRFRAKFLTSRLAHLLLGCS
jgi:hypothetical protein